MSAARKSNSRPRAAAKLNQPVTVGCLKVAEAALELGIPAMQIGNLIDEGKLGAIDISTSRRTHHWRIPKAEVEAYRRRNSSHAGGAK